MVEQKQNLFFKVGLVRFLIKTPKLTSKNLIYLHSYLVFYA